MPLRDYTCDACGHRFEKLERTGSRARARCPECGGTKLMKAFSSFAVAAATSTPSRTPAPCGDCGHPNGPGSGAIEA